MAMAQSAGKRFLSKFGIYLVLLLTSVIVLFPFYMTVLTAFKQPADARNFILALPEKWNLSNFQQVLKRGGYWPALQNSTIVTVFATIGTLLLNTILSYFLGRNQHKKFFNFSYYWFIIGIFIPFQVVMIPLVVMGKTFGMLNIPGLICMHIALSFPTNVFLMTGFVKGVPRDVDEAAMIDGCGPIRTFYQIIAPMMSPIIATALVLTVLGVWNDFTLPLVILQRGEKTLPLFIYNYRTKYITNFNLAFAAYTLSMIPPMVVYLFCQKYIIKGLAAGAVKG